MKGLNKKKAEHAEEMTLRVEADIKYYNSADAPLEGAALRLKLASLNDLLEHYKNMKEKWSTEPDTDAEPEQGVPESEDE